jgi:hypothetical protein
MHDAHQVEPQVVEHQPGAAHAGNVKAAPARRESRKYETVGPGRMEPAKSPVPKFKRLVIVADMKPKIDRPEIIAHLVAAHAVIACGSIDEKNFHDVLHEKNSEHKAKNIACIFLAFFLWNTRFFL